MVVEKLFNLQCPFQINELVVETVINELLQPTNSSLPLFQQVKPVFYSALALSLCGEDNKYPPIFAKVVN